MWGEVENLEDLIEQGAHGFAPLQSFQNRDLPHEQVNLIQDYQLGAFASDIAQHRTGANASDRLIQLLGVLSGCFDATGLYGYRALAIGTRYSYDLLHDELSVNSWSLKPGMAIGVALSMDRGRESPIVLLRRRFQKQDNTLYLDDFEEEVLCPAVRLRLGRTHIERILFRGRKLYVVMIDCVTKVR